MIFKHYASFVKTLFNFIKLPEISLGYFFTSFKTILYKEIKHLNDISKKTNFHLSFNILKRIQSVQIVSTTLILNKSDIFCNSIFKLSLKLNRKNPIKKNSLSCKIFAIKQLRMVI